MKERIPSPCVDRLTHPEILVDVCARERRRLRGMLLSCIILPVLELEAVPDARLQHGGCGSPTSTARGGATEGCATLFAANSIVGRATNCERVMGTQTQNTGGPGNTRVTFLRTEPGWSLAGGGELPTCGEMSPARIRSCQPCRARHAASSLSGRVGFVGLGCV